MCLCTVLSRTGTVYRIDIRVMNSDIHKIIIGHKTMRIERSKFEHARPFLSFLIGFLRCMYDLDAEFDLKRYFHSLCYEFLRKNVLHVTSIIVLHGLRRWKTTSGAAACICKEWPFIPNKLEKYVCHGTQSDVLFSSFLCA